MLNLEVISNSMKIQGFEMEPTSKTVVGTEIIEGSIETQNGILTVLVGSNGTMDVYKPNGKMKRSMPATTSKAIAQIKQTVRYNNNQGW